MQTPFSQKKTLTNTVKITQAVKLACDELIQNWGSGAYDRATYLAWEEDFGLTSMSKPGHWWHVRREIDRRSDHETLEPQVVGSAFPDPSFVVGDKMNMSASTDLCPHVYIDRNAGSMFPKPAATFPRSDPTSSRQRRRTIMKRIVLAFAVLGSVVTFSATDANAFVCARGLFRAGCVGPNGAIGVRR